jgi:signal transduction histidine kinase
VAFRVLDTGPGVEPSELELIFDSFYRSERTAHLPGKGLGLSICKRLTEAQGGQIWARLRPTGGLEVGFSIPKSD